MRAIRRILLPVDLFEGSLGAARQGVALLQALPFEEFFWREIRPARSFSSRTRNVST